MAYFPFYIDIENKNILVVGGGTVALRKIEKLLLLKLPTAVKLLLTAR